MIGHYLLTLTPEQEDRILTGKLRPGDWAGPCLVGAALGPTNARLSAQFICNRRWPMGLGAWYASDADLSVEARYDKLCRRFGARVNAAIRNRILSNRARRELAPVSREALCGVSSTRGENP